MPFAQWPGMWQPITRAASPVATRGTVHTTSTRWPDATTTRRPASSGGTLTSGRRAGRMTDRRSLRCLPRILDRGVPDHDLMDLEAAIDEVEQDGFARYQVDRIGQEFPVLGDDVHLARGRRIAGRYRRRGWGRAGLASGDQEDNGQRWEASGPRGGHGPESMAPRATRPVTA